MSDAYTQKKMHTFLATLKGIPAGVADVLAVTVAFGKKEGPVGALVARTFIGEFRALTDAIAAACDDAERSLNENDPGN